MKKNLSEAQTLTKYFKKMSKMLNRTKVPIIGFVKSSWYILYKYTNSAMIMLIKLTKLMLMRNYIILSSPLK